MCCFLFIRIITDIAELMPTDSRYVTILRDPVTMFESIFTYFKYDVIYGIKGATPLHKLRKFLHTPTYFYNLERAEGYQGHGKNPMLYDFGLEDDQKENRSAVEDLITSISTRFDLVMMTEHFYESLILLKEHMCWTLDDITFLPLNTRTKSTVPVTTPQMSMRIRQWNEGDVKLYDHFNRSFWRKVHNFGLVRMADEVRILKERNAYFRELCIEGVSNNTDEVWHPEDVYIDAFQVREEMKGDKRCVAMTTSELQFTDEIRYKFIRQYFTINITNPHAS